MKLFRFIRSLFCFHWYIGGDKCFYPGRRECGETHDVTIQNITCRKCGSKALLRIETPMAPEPVKWGEGNLTSKQS